MIPTLDVLPSASGQDGKAAHLSSTQENSGVGEKSKPFGEVLDSQEKSSANTANQEAAKDSQEDSGKSLQKGGKELPEGESTAADGNKGSTDSDSVKNADSSTSQSEQVAKAPEGSQSNGIEKAGQQTVQGFQQELEISKIVVSDQSATKLLPDQNDSVSGKTVAANAIENRPLVSTEGNQKILPGTIASLALAKDSSAKTGVDTPVVPTDTELTGKAGDLKAATQTVLSGVTPEGITRTPTANQNFAANVRSSASINTTLDGQLLQSGKLGGDDFPGLQQGLDVKGVPLPDSLEQLLANVEGAKVKSPGALSSTAQQPSAAISGITGGVASSTDVDNLTGVRSASGSFSMSSAVGDPGWDGEFVGRINMLVKGGVQEARIQLSPPDMGRLDIKISTEGDATKVVFAVENIAAKDAIEQAMPRLKDLLEQGGLQLSHSEVADHSQSQKGGSDSPDELVGREADQGADDESEVNHSWQLGLSSSNSTVDYYI